MKMRPEHFAALKAAVAPLDTPERRAQYMRGDYKNAERTKDRPMRYRWDLLWMSNIDTREMDAYLNGDNIDTALNVIVPDGEL